MLNIFRIILLSALIIPIASCGVKGKLKSPAQIEREDAKKARDAEKKAKDKADAQAVEPVAPVPAEPK